MTDTTLRLSKIIIDSLFDENFRVSAFFFVMGILVLEIIYLNYSKKHGGITNRVILVILAVSTAVGGSLLIADRNDKYDAPQIFTYQGGGCLEEVYADIFEEYEDEFDGTQTEKYLAEMTYVHETGGRDERWAFVSHFLVDMYIFSAGYMLLFLVFAGKRRVLSAFMAFPTGVSLVCAAGVFFILLGIPFRRAAIGGAGVLIMAALIGLTVRARKSPGVRMEGDFSGAAPAGDAANTSAGAGAKATAKIFAAAAGVFILLIWGRSAWLSPDSVEKTMYGMMLAEYSLTRTEIFAFSAFGFLEPIIHAVAWKCGVDYLYSFYPSMAICSLGIIASAASGFWGARPRTDEDRLRIALVTGVSLIFLASNNEFATLGVWVLSNGAVGTYILMIVVYILLLKDDIALSKAVAAPVCLVFFTLLITRVEGGCYIALLLILALGIRRIREGYLYIFLAAAAEMILWNALQFVFFSGVNSQFWNPKNGLIVIAGALVLAALALLSPLRVGAIEWIMRHFYPLCLGVLALAAIACVFLTGEFGAKTFYVFMHHLAASDYNNSAAFWSFLLLMLPLMVSGRRKTAALSISIIGCYLLMTLIIMCLRADNISHLAIGDSGRRVISQIMPAAMLGVAISSGPEG